MCIAFFTTTQPGYKLIIAANRDEFYDRPATPAEWHSFDTSDHRPPSVLSGRDIADTGGGTWIGMTRDMRIGLMYVPGSFFSDCRTNVRDPASAAGAAIRKPGAPSRGRLLRSFLDALPTATPLTRFTNGLTNLDAYDGFNLLLFNIYTKMPHAEVAYVSNRPEGRAGMLQTSEGIRGISNTPLDSPWPKVTEGQTMMDQELRAWNEAGETEDELVQRLMRLLRRSIVVKTILDAPNCTCIPPIELAGRWYGTRVSTVILVSDENEVTFVERDIGGMKGDVGAFLDSEDRTFRFRGISYLR